MYTSFVVENFRCLEHLTVESLARVNLIAGKNNTGKTALLEALWLHSGPNIPELGLRLSAFRGLPGQNPDRLLQDLFYKFDASKTIRFSADGDWEGLARTLKVKSQPLDAAKVAVPILPDSSVIPRGSQEPNVSAASSSQIVLDYTDESGGNFVSTGWWVVNRLGVPPMGGPVAGVAYENSGMAAEQAKMPKLPSSVLLNPRLRTSPHAEELTRFGEAELAGYADRIVECLRVLEPGLKRLTTIAAPPGPMIYADTGLGRLVPVPFMGDGISRLLSMALAFHGAQNGTLLIDEVENGLHHSVLVDVWKSLDWLSREFNVQVFATTHSYECIAAARDAFAAAEEQDLALHRLGRWKDGPIGATTYEYESLSFCIDFPAEVR